MLHIFPSSPSVILNPNQHRYISLRFQNTNLTTSKTDKFGETAPAHSGETYPDQPFHFSNHELNIDPNVFSFSRHEHDLKHSPLLNAQNMQEIRTNAKKMRPNPLEGLNANKFTLEYTVELVEKLFEQKLLYNNK